MRPPFVFARRARAGRAASPAIAAHVVAAVNLALSAAVWLALSSALLYSQGRAYRDAYLGTYGVDAELLPWDQGTLAYWGMLVGTLGFFNSVLLPTVVIAMWFVLLWVVTEWLSTRRGPRTSSRAPTGKPQPTPFLIRACFGVAGAMALVAVVLLGFQWIQYQAQRRGVDDAQREMRKIDRCAPAVFNPTDGFRPVRVERAVHDGHMTEDGFIVTCTERYCALYNPQQHHTQVVPLDQLVRFETVRAEQVYWGRS